MLPSLAIAAVVASFAPRSRIPPLRPPASALGDAAHGAVVAVHAPAQRAEWGPWQPLADGHDDGVDISFKKGRFKYDGGAYEYRYRLRNRYRVPVTIEVDISTEGSARASGEGATIPAGGIASGMGQYLITRRITGTRVRSIRRAGDRGGTPGTGERGARAAARPGRGATYAQCRRAAAYRDGRLATIHAVAGERFRVNRDAQADLRRFRRQMLEGNGSPWDRMPATGDWARLRDVGLWVMNTSAGYVKLAVKMHALAPLFAEPVLKQVWGAPPTPAEVIEAALSGTADADEAFKEAAERRAARTLLPEWRTARQAVADAAEWATNARSLRDTDEDRAELRRLVRTTLQRLDASVATYAAAADREHATLSGAQAYLTALDRWMRTECAYADPARPAVPPRAPAQPSTWHYLP